MSVPVGVGVIGCGFVADYYLRTMALHPQLRVVGVADRDGDRAAALAEAHGVVHHDDPVQLLDDDRIRIVVNLTDPRSHHTVSRAALDAGRHVYSEKPLAMSLDEARRLVELAEADGLWISSAPCSLVGPTAQTLWQALRDDVIGPVRVVYAEMDEGLVHRMPIHRWRSATGVPWPYRDEFELGTVLEHAGYVASWLPAMFGRAVTVTGSAHCIVDDKAGVPTDGTDLSIAAVQFDSGVVARLTCSLLAPHDHSLRVIGDRGVLSVDDTWSDIAPVHLRRSITLGPRHQWLPRRRIGPPGRGRRYRYRGTQQLDFGRGVAELADAVRERRPPRLSAAYSLHVTELVLALDRGLREGCSYTMTTTGAHMEPMPWPS